MVPVKPSSGRQSPHIQQLVNQALAHHSAGRLPEAEEIYRQILQQEPGNFTAMHLLGVIAYQVGNNDAAVDLISRALLINPDFAEAHYNLGNALHSLGNLEKAITSFHKAITIRADYAEAFVNLGNVLKESGRVEEAASSHRKALSLKPDFVEALVNLGSALQDLGQLEDAINSYQRALAINPVFIEAHCNMGGAYQDLGQLEDAINSYQKALAINGDFADAHYNLGIALREQGKMDAAFTSQRRAIALNPQYSLFWNGFATSLQNFSFTAVDGGLLDDLLQLIKQPTVRPADVVRPIISAIRQSPAFPDISEKPEVGMAIQLSSMPLLLRIMGLSPINDLAIERLFTALRGAMLQETLTGKADDRAMAFWAALALHCFTNEYVYSETPEEKNAVVQLEQKIAGHLDDGQDIPPSWVMALGAYRPLYRYPWAQQLARRQWSDEIGQLIKRQILEPTEERALGSQIASLTPITGEVSQSVRAQYEESPYPRWIKTGIREKPKTIAAELRGAPLRFDLGDYVSPENPEILLAGCGTGQQALLTACRFSGARVLAMDLSLSSLSYGLRKTAELGFSNITYGQGDIMEMASLGRQFDLIESMGVLHHLGDPLAGWRLLTDLLKDGGVMMVGLYSEAARQDVVAGRSLISEKGYGSTPDDIRRCRQDIIALAEQGDRQMADVCRRRDFFALSECRDLLFHVQEHRFTLPEIEAALESLGLTFLGFEMRDQQALNTFKKSHPDKSALTSLALWHDFEADHRETFRSMYRFWCQKR